MRREGLLILALLWSRTLLGGVFWPPEGVEKELGLPDSTSGGREVRVWLGGGVVRPYDLYRIFETGHHGFSGERIVWMEVEHPAASTSAKEASRKTQESRRFLEQDFCHGPVTETANYLWCRIPVEGDVTWKIVFEDLMPDRLWELPKELERKCGYVMMDGESVGIEILAGERRHAVAYDNPEFCCSQIPCAIADHVRAVVRGAL